jgi:large subunit ribosomal protein L9
MEVILLEHVRKLGNFGDVVSVKGGFARNFLLPFKKALLATEINKEKFERKKEEIAKSNAEAHAVAKKLFEKVDKTFVTLIRQAGEDGKLFGSVSSRDIADELSNAVKHTFSKNHVTDLAPVKYLGVYEIQLTLHPEVIASIRVIVARSETEALEAKKTFLNPPKQKDAEQEILSSITTKNKREESSIESEETIESDVPEQL